MFHNYNQSEYYLARIEAMEKHIEKLESKLELTEAKLEVSQQNRITL
jgi:hypothetical protein|tara:strand:- start:48 stop:188 length:141 start_codon:yes stop_codon:yes gene_type:complete